MGKCECASVLAMNSFPVIRAERYSKGLPAEQPTARRDNSPGYGLTRGSPCSTAVKEAWMCERLGRGAARMRVCPRLWSADGVLPGPRCSEMESMPFRVGLDAEWLWEVVSCSLAIDSMTWDSLAKAWTRAGSVCWQRDVSSTCLHIDPRTLRVWRVHIPKVSPPGPRNDLSVTLPVFHALLATAPAAIETFRSTCASVFTDTAMDYLPVAVRLCGVRCMDDMAEKSAVCVAYYSLPRWVEKLRHRVSTGH